MGSLIYIFGSVCLIYGCISNKFEKKGINVFLILLGFVLMCVSPVVK